MLTAPSAMPCAWSIRDGMPKPTRRDARRCGSVADDSASSSSSASCDVVTVGRSTVSCTVPSRSTIPGEDLGPAEVDADHAIALPWRRVTYPAGWREEEKPYRVYRGGRAKGKVPTRPPPGAAAARRRAARAALSRLPRPGGTDAEAPPLGARIGIALGVLVLLLIVWGVAGWLSFSSGVSDANKRLDARGARRRSPRRAGSCSRTRRRSCCSAPTTRRSRHAPATALRLDHAAAHRPVAPPPLLPLDPARPRGADPGSRHAEDQRGVPDRRRRRSRSGRSATSPASRSTT